MIPASQLLDLAKDSSSLEPNSLTDNQQPTINNKQQTTNNQQLTNESKFSLCGDQRSPHRPSPYHLGSSYPISSR
ncbi:MAG TPA: hypothetical protein DCL61_16200 [Cyanobacteria bacterium UBA12227]|nr:hypothetical protein [Cyanobacteria bacterium UBA12227]HAX86346.1 hypothetical protein [Cyanobacteria bacterium UBA11370]